MTFNFPLIEVAWNRMARRPSGRRVFIFQNKQFTVRGGSLIQKSCKKVLTLGGKVV